MKQYKIKINGNSYDVTVGGIDENGKANVIVGGKEYEVEIEKGCIPAAASAPATPVQTVAAAPAPTAAPATVPAQATAPATAAGGKDIVSPLPGVIIGISVNVGDKVSAGQAVATLEAMKMENAIEAEVAGTVQAIHVQKGDSVLEGARIVTIA